MCGAVNEGNRMGEKQSRKSQVETANQKSGRVKIYASQCTGRLV